MTAWDYKIWNDFAGTHLLDPAAYRGQRPCGYAAALDTFAHQHPAAKRFYTHAVHFASCFELS